MESATGTIFDILDTVGMNKTGAFPTRLSSNTSISFNFGDAHESNIIQPSFLFLGHILGQYNISNIRLSAIEKGSYNFIDLLWMNLDEREPIDSLPLDFGAIGAENAAFRSGWDVSKDIYAAIHFGANDAYHGHLDMGTFVIDYAGKRFFCDLGPDDYNLPEYRKLYRIRAEGHNTLVINSDFEFDQNFHAGTLISEYKEGDISYAKADMSPAFKGQTVYRTLSLNHKTKEVTLFDEIKCDENDLIYWFAHSKADIVLEDNNKVAILTKDGIKLKAEIVSSGLEFTIEDPIPLPSSPNNPNQSPNPGVKKLRIKTSGNKEFKIEIKFSPIE